MFLVNSRLGHFTAASRRPSEQSKTVSEGQEAPLLPKLRGYFAEFLNEGSLAHLGILCPPTCVGLRYGHCEDSLEAFPGRSVTPVRLRRSLSSSQLSGYDAGGFAYRHSLRA